MSDEKIQHLASSSSLAAFEQLPEQPHSGISDFSTTDVGHHDDPIAATVTGAGNHSGRAYDSADGDIRADHGAFAHDRFECNATANSSA